MALRHVSIALSISLAFLLSGCGSSSSSGKDDPNVLRLAHNVTGGKSAPIMDDICHEFEERNPGVTVQQIAMDDDIYQDIGLMKLFSGGNPPDVYFQYGDWLIRRDVAADRALDLTDYLDDDGWREEFHESSWECNRVDGRDYMIPDSIGTTTFIWYNSKLFRDLGMRVPKTWDDFVELCRDAKAAGLVPISAGNNEKWPLGNWGAHIVSRVGGEDLYQDVMQLKPGTRFANPDFIKGLTYLHQLVQEGFFNEGVIGLSDEEGQMLFRAEQALFHPIGAWVIDMFINEVPDLEFDYFNTPAFPEGKGNQESVLGHVSGYMVYKHTPRKDLAIRFLKYYTSPEVQRRFVAVGVFSTVKAAHEGVSEPHLEKIRHHMESEPLIVAPADVGFSVDVANHFYDAINDVIGGLAGPAEALKKCDERVERLRQRRALSVTGGSSS